MKNPAHSIVGVDPDVFCSPEYFGLHDLLSLSKGSVVADFPPHTGRVGFGWKKAVAELAFKRRKNKQISDDQFQRINAWLERNRVDYSMLPNHVDPRFSNVDTSWNSLWGWPRNAAASLESHVEAVISVKELEPDWPTNNRWRRLHPTRSIRECVPEIDDDERAYVVERKAAELAGLVAHPLRFGNVLKVIDPHADYERWHETLEAMIRSAGKGLKLELHCARVLDRRASGPTESFRNNWTIWAGQQVGIGLAGFQVYFWEELTPKMEELHDRYAIVGVSTQSGAVPFAGVEVGKGWDQAPPKERGVTTGFRHLSKTDLNRLWKIYADGSEAFSRKAEEDVIWPVG